jgi:hypothetical protein
MAARVWFKKVYNDIYNYDCWNLYYIIIWLVYINMSDTYNEKKEKKLKQVIPQKQ